MQGAGAPPPDALRASPHPEGREVGSGAGAGDREGTLTEGVPLQ